VLMNEKRMQENSSEQDSKRRYVDPPESGSRVNARWNDREAKLDYVMKNASANRSCWK